MVKISVVLPVMNEVANIDPIYQIIKELLVANGFEYEIIFICDPSDDGTESKIKDLVKLDGCVRGIFLADRAGQTEAMRAGYEHASGDAVISMDADFQDPPEIIIALINSWQKGSLIVHSERRDRKSDKLLYRIATNFGYKLLSWLTAGRVKHNVGDFRLIDKFVLPLILQFKDPNPFWRGITSLSGIKSETVFYTRPSRRAGKTKYGNIIGSPSVALRGLASFSNKPLEFLQFLGVMAVIFSFLVILTIITTQFIFPGFPRGIPTLIALISVFFAIQFASTAIIATYLIVLVEQTRRRPNYILNPNSED